jgi:hypothetical protein
VGAAQTAHSSVLGNLYDAADAFLKKPTVAAPANLTQDGEVDMLKSRLFSCIGILRGAPDPACTWALLSCDPWGTVNPQQQKQLPTPPSLTWLWPPLDFPRLCSRWLLLPGIQGPRFWPAAPQLCPGLPHDAHRQVCPEDLPQGVRVRVYAGVQGGRAIPLVWQSRSSGG